MIKNWKLTVTMTGEPPVVVAVTPRVILDFEREFKVGLVGAMSNEMRLEQMFWLGWKSMHRAGHVVRPFDAWCEDLEDIELQVESAPLDEEPSVDSSPRSPSKPG